MSRKITEEGLDLIKQFEGLRLEAYQCSAGVWTIGYGHTLGVQEGDTISEVDADDFLAEDIGWAESEISRGVRVPISDNQFSALVSLVFNIGKGAFRASTLLKKLNDGEYDEAADEFLRWNKVHGKTLAGLTRRREAERELFLDT